MTPSGSDMVAETVEALKKHRFGAHRAADVAEAQERMLAMIPTDARVNVGDSATLRQSRVLEALAERGNEVVNPFNRELMAAMGADPAAHAEFLRLNRQAYTSDVFLTGCNALTADGKIVSTDGIGNRVSATIFGAPTVILIVGRNKIVPDFEAAIDRIRNVIAPEHARRKGRKTPCAVTGRCEDCNSPQRVCNVTVVLERRPICTDLTVVLVDDDLGLGWHPAWAPEHIQQIRDAYYRHTWTHVFPKTG